MRIPILRTLHTPCVLLAMLLLVIAASARPAHALVTSYQLKLFADKQAALFNTPTHEWSYWFELKRGMTMTDPCYVQMWFTCAPTILENSSGMTLLLNGVPLDSIDITRGTRGTIAWRVTLPTKEFQIGFNEIRIACRIRSIDGECRDIDNKANWVQFNTASFMVLHIACKSPINLDLYPYPFLDHISDTPLKRTTFCLDSNPSEVEVGALLHLASDWGRRLPSKVLTPRVSTRERERAGLTGHQVVITHDGSVALESTTTRDGSGRLTIAADEDGRFRNVLATLGSAQQMRLLSGVTADVKPPTKPASYPIRPHVGKFTLADLGYPAKNPAKNPAIALRGAFHQRAAIMLGRPVRTKLGRTSEFTIHFRHSKHLVEHRSALTILINGMEVASAKYTTENANDGFIRARIPVALMAANAWYVEFHAYHDLGQIDCGKRWDEVAWTTIWADSFFKLERGRLDGLPYLEQFPYLIGANGVPPKSVTMWLSEAPTDAELTAAAAIAIRAGQTNGLPINWRVVMGNTIGEGGDSGVVILLGLNDDPRFDRIPNKHLYIKPGLRGPRYIDQKLGLFLSESAITRSLYLQAHASPWRPRDGVLYLASADTPEALLNGVGLLTRPPNTTDNKQMVGGQVARLAQGTVEPISITTDEEVQQMIKAEANSYTGPMTATMLIIGALCCLLFVSMVRFFTKRAPDAPTSNAGV